MLHADRLVARSMRHSDSGMIRQSRVLGVADRSSAGGPRNQALARNLKILISCAYLTFAWPIRTLKRPFRTGQSASLVILYYHGVSRSQRAGFARQMEFLQRHASIVPADWRGGPIKGRVCAITFDDGFVSTFDNALPELQARQIHCTIFVPPGVMGRAPDWQTEEGVTRDEVVADADTIKRFMSPLVAIGSHTLSHCRLSRIPRDIARSEVERSRAVLDATLGQDTRLISFPYGDHDGAVADLCEKAGYEFMYSIEPVPVNPRSLDRVRGRVSVSPDDSLLEIYLKSAGGYRWMPVASAIKRWIRRGRS
jgi:peptidoglycan/xylan/chitin deacetylase (PgdA/CDA1 family)